MANLGQLFGEDRLRIMQLEDELAEARGRAVSVKPLQVRTVGASRRILDLLETAKARMTQKDIESALPDVKPMTIYMALRTLRRAAPALVDVKGTGFNNNSYRYAMAGRFDESA